MSAKKCLYMLCKKISAGLKLVFLNENSKLFSLLSELNKRQTKKDMDSRSSKA